MPPRSSNGGTYNFLSAIFGRDIQPETAIFAPRQGRYVKPASKLTRAGRERDVRAYQRANPAADRSEALRETRKLRRQGYEPRTVARGRASTEQVQSAYAYETERIARQEARQRLLERREYLAQTNITFIAHTDGGAELVSLPANQISAADRSRIGRHMNHVKKLLNGTPAQAHRAAANIRQFRNSTVTWNGMVFLLESDPDAIEILLINEPFSPESIYTQIVIVEAA